MSNNTLAAGFDTLCPYANVAPVARNFSREEVAAVRSNPRTQPNDHPSPQIASSKRAPFIGPRLLYGAACPCVVVDGAGNWSWTRAIRTRESVRSLLFWRFQTSANMHIPKQRRDERGMAALMVILILAMMVAFVAANTNALLQLKREIKNVDKRQEL